MNLVDLYRAREEIISYYDLRIEKIIQRNPFHAMGTHQLDPTIDIVSIDKVRRIIGISNMIYYPPHRYVFQNEEDANLAMRRLTAYLINRDYGD
jgi:hypothetical protein